MKLSGVSKIALAAGFAATMHYTVVPYSRREDGKGPIGPDAPPLAALTIASTGDTFAGVIHDTITDAEYSVAPASDWERKLQGLTTKA
jgi:hypothetical protein